MAFIQIPTNWRDVGKPVSEQLINRISDNLDDLNSRVSAVEVITGNIIIFNEIVKLPDVTVGEQKVIYRTEASVQSGDDGLGSTWNLTDGSDVTGSDYASIIGETVLPDARGRFMRMQDNGAGVNPDATGLRVNQEDEIKSHNHGTTKAIGGYSGHIFCGGWGSCGSYQQGRAYITNTGGAETRPKSTTANFYTKTDFDTYETRRLFRVPQNISISIAEITALIAGTSGTLEVDILTGSNLASLTSIFSTRPSVTVGAGNYATSTNQVISNFTANTNEWVEMRIISLQSGQRNFYLNVQGTPI